MPPSNQLALPIRNPLQPLPPPKSLKPPKPLINPSSSNRKTKIKRPNLQLEFNLNPKMLRMHKLKILKLIMHKLKILKLRMHKPRIKDSKILKPKIIKTKIKRPNPSLNLKLLHPNQPRFPLPNLKINLPNSNLTLSRDHPGISTTKIEDIINPGNIAHIMLIPIINPIQMMSQIMPMIIGPRGKTSNFTKIILIITTGRDIRTMSREIKVERILQ